MEIFQTMRKQLLAHNIGIEDLFRENAEFISFADKIINRKRVDHKEFDAFLRLCLDIYAYSEDGKVIIPDRTYDECMEVWTDQGNNVIVYPDDVLGDNHWQFIEHEIPGMVGSLPKIYEYKEFKKYMDSMREYYDVTKYILAPKFDGISVCIKLVDGNMVYATTRYDGNRGQNIVNVISKATNANDFWKTAFTTPQNGYYKCEIVVTTPLFEKLIEEKPYTNRRSATSGIVSTPKNIALGKYLTIIPLLFYNGKDRKYIPPDAQVYEFYNSRDMMDTMEGLLTKFRDRKYPIRVDGIVMYPISTRFQIDEGNLLEFAAAFKVNTAEGRTTIEYVYMSVGPLGGAIPMAKVKPVEVNETIVTDVSLGSYEKFMSLTLYEGEEVIVYSAGDAIPQLKKTGHANNVYDMPYLKIKKVCPYCGEKLQRVTTEYKCANPKCVRVITGKMINFASKMGIQNFSDKTFEDFFNAGITKSIEDLFRITREDIMSVEGYRATSADKFLKEIDKIRNRRVTVSELFGALGIPNISKKKCVRIFEQISLKDLLKAEKKGQITSIIINADGIGLASAETFAGFVMENQKLIKFLVGELQVVGDVRMKGTVVFTGFRNGKWEDKFHEIGYAIGDSVTNTTVAVVSANTDFSSTKCQTAIRRGIPLTTYAEIDKLYEKLKRQ